jgi:transmembrane sensor
MEAPWDELREQRVLRRALDERAARPARTRRRRAMAAIVAAASLSLVALALFAIVRSPSVAESTEVATLTLADGSRIRQKNDARLSVTKQESALVEIAQTAGSAEYEVSPNPERLFVVRAPGVTIRVLGTVFSVEVREAGVHVSVSRGRVSVDDGARHVVLGAGEEWRLVSTPAGAPPDTATAQPAPPAAPPSAAPGEPRAPPSASASAGPVAPAPPEDSPDEMLRRADALRAGGNLAGAAAVLEKFLARFPRDRRATPATFTLARVERARGNAARAAQLFRSVARGTLAEDALAEEAASWQSAGNGGEARAAAARYLARFPNGTHAERMRRIVE